MSVRMSFPRALMCGLAVIGWAMSAQADTPPELQALIDQRGEQLEADAERLGEIQQLDTEQRRLEFRLEGVDSEGREAAENLEDAVNQFGQNAQQLADKLKEAAENPGNLSVSDIAQIDRDVDRLLDNGESVGEAVDDARAEDVGGNIFGGHLFFTGQVLLVRTNGVVQSGVDSISGVGVNDPILGPLADRLNRLAEVVEQQAEQAASFGAGIKRDEFNRLEQLQNEQATRDQERADIDQRENAQAEGGDVLAALNDRLGDSDAAENGRFAGDQEAADRVQELANGLAGAGQRIAEINAEIQQAENDLEQLVAEREPVQNALFQAQTEATAGDDPDGQIRDIERAIDITKEDIERIREDGDPKALAEAENRLRQFEQALDKTREVKANIEAGVTSTGQTARERAADLVDKFNAFAPAIGELGVKLEALRKERAAIAALQAELANLIRNGAPLGPQIGVATENSGASGNKKSADARKIDAFLNGGQIANLGGNQLRTEDGALPQGVEEAAGQDPLGLDQFGFDADQGGTEGILNGENVTGAGGALIPCPPGSNLLTPGTLVSNTALCFI